MDVGHDVDHDELLIHDVDHDELIRVVADQERHSALVDASSSVRVLKGLDVVVRLLHCCFCARKRHEFLV